MIFNIVIFLLVLSLLIFFHEMGHFLAAKACNIFVDRFSIGMPPRIFGIRLGETDYCVGALPIGGYVKMAGQEDAPLSDEEREQEYGHVPPERWFNNRPLWQRYIVVLGGPFMNFVLALLLYGVLTVLGSDVPEMQVSARLGKIEKDSPAQSAPLYREREGASPESYSGNPDSVGWQTGDVVLKIGGREVESYSDIFFAAVIAGEGSPQTVVLERTDSAGDKVRYVSIVEPRVFGEVEHPRFGVGPFASVLVKEVIAGMPAEQTGLKEGDIILRANGNAVDRTTFVELTEQTPEGGTLDLLVERDGQQLDVVIQPQTIGRIKGLRFDSAGPDPAQAPPLVTYVSPEFEKETGLQRKDVIAKVDGQAVTAKQLRDLELTKPDGRITAEIERPAILFGLIQTASKLTLELPVDAVRAVGVDLGEKMVHLDVPPSQWVSHAFHRSYEDLRQTIVTLRALVFGSVSPKMLGGPVMIAGAITQAARLGFEWLIGMTALISINLAVFNLLPLPILDGGLVVINTIEAIRRKPLSPKFQERFQQAGLFFIIALMLFVTWNDIGRWLGDLRP
jgi:regulator of sigma E protease